MEPIYVGCLTPPPPFLCSVYCGVNLGVTLISVKHEPCVGSHPMPSDHLPIYIKTIAPTMCCVQPSRLVLGFAHTFIGWLARSQGGPTEAMLEDFAEVADEA
jgi:hypothetical protein